MMIQVNDFVTHQEQNGGLIKGNCTVTGFNYIHGVIIGLCRDDLLTSFKL